MAKERLSKLQKWILLRIYERGKSKKSKKCKDYSICRKEIVEFYGLKQGGWWLCCNDKKYTKPQVAITNSIHNLINKGLVEVRSYRGEYKKFIYSINITQKGYPLLLILDKINNKKIKGKEKK